MGSEVMDSQDAPKCDICAFCLQPGADTRYNPTFWVWVHRSCLDKPGRLEAMAQGKCFFCLEGSHLPDMTPFAPVSPTATSWDDPDELAWAHRSCVDWFETVLDEATDPGAVILPFWRHGGL